MHSPFWKKKLRCFFGWQKTLSSDGDAEEMIESRSDRSRRSKPEKKIYESKWMARITGNFNLPWYKSSPCRRLISAIPIAELNIRGVFDGFSQEGYICFQAAISRDFAAGEADPDSFQSTNASRADLDKVSKKSKKTRTEGMTASALCTMYVQYGMT